MATQLQDGTYRGRMVRGSAVTTKAQTAGSLQVVMQWDLDHYWNGQAWQPLPEGTQRTMYLSCHDNSIQYTIKKLDSMGWNGDFVKPEFADDVHDEGRNLILRSEEYKGKTTQKLELANWGGGEFEPAPDHELKSLAARVAAMRPKRPAGRPTPPPPATNPAVANATPPSNAAGGAASGAATTASSVASSAPTTPPPAASTQPAPPSTSELPPITTKAGAWDRWCRAAADGMPSLDEWNRAIAKVGEGKPESEFGEAEWASMSAIAENDIPF